jgi:hypothetical protein
MTGRARHAPGTSTPVPLQTTEEVLRALRSRCAALEIEMARVKAYIEQGEGLQDKVNLRVASRLAALEAGTSPE